MWQNCKRSFLYCIGAGIYIVAVAALMQNAEKIFGKVDSIVSVTAFLLLFSLSVFVVGGLLAAKPIMLYIDGKKKEAVSWLISSAGWMLLFFAIALLILAIK
jgi:hypothetical protein